MKNIIIILSYLIASVALSGPINLRDEKALKDHKAKKTYEASTNYYSADQFAADVAAVKNFTELQAIMLKKAKAEQAEAKTKKDIKTAGTTPAK